MGGGGPGRAPPRWLDCPRKSERLIGSRWRSGCPPPVSPCWLRFLAFKTPLDERYDDQVPPANRFSPNMLFQSMKAFKVKIGLWIDLTKTSRFVSPPELLPLLLLQVLQQEAGRGSGLQICAVAMQGPWRIPWPRRCICVHKNLPVSLPQHLNPSHFQSYNKL